MDASPFVLFGSAHLVALGLTAALALTACLVESAQKRWARWLMAGALVSMLVATLTVRIIHRGARVWDFLPLQLCDLAIFIAAWALITRQRAATEVLYYWACTGTLLAMVVPAVATGFPSFHFIAYFALHGGVVIAALWLVWGCDLRPRPGSVWRVWLWTNAYAALVGAIDVIFDRNYLFLCGKPRVSTLLDFMGPWPVYIIVADLIGLGLFWLLYLPHRRSSPETQA